MFPELSQLGPDDSYAYWQDLEVKIVSRSLAESIYAQLLMFWNRATVGQNVSKFNQLATPDDAGKFSNSEIQIRHFLSLPFNDNHALEDLYVKMIKCAKSSIKISSPYLRPTKKIMDALLYALRSNPELDVTIQTRISLEGDTQAWLYEETNKAAINELFNKVKIFEWKEESILHSKLLVVDDLYSFVGSVNLIRRSFVQDVENALVIKNEHFAKQLKNLINSYVKNQGRLLVSKKESFGPALLCVYLKINSK